MKTLIVWLLIANSGSQGRVVVPNLPSYEECQRLGFELKGVGKTGNPAKNSFDCYEYKTAASQ
jgi:hypothetical protein